MVTYNKGVDFLKTEEIRVRVTPEVKGKFKKILKGKCINMSALITKWIENYIKEESNG